MGNTGCYGCGGVPVGAPMITGGMAPIATGPMFDADPITPGIQTTPGVVTAVGPPRVVGGGPSSIPPIGMRPGPAGFGNGYGGGFGGGFGGADADPITPGFQTRPGVVTAVGPSRTVGGGYGMSPARPGFIPAASMVRFWFDYSFKYLLILLN